MRKTASAVRRVAVRGVVVSTGGGEQNRVAEREKAGAEIIGCGVGERLAVGKAGWREKTGGRSCAVPRFCQFFGVFRMRDVPRGKTLDKRGKSCYNEGNPNAMRERSTSKDGSKRARAGESRAARVGGITLRSSKPNSAGARVSRQSVGAPYAARYAGRGRLTATKIGGTTAHSARPIAARLCFLFYQKKRSPKRCNTRIFGRSPAG